jgi:DNA repair protein SbcD/Mre11
MKFAHLADCHIGGWRDEALKELSIASFEKAIQICIEKKVGFVLIAGDLFDTALPSIDILKRVANTLKDLKEHDISTYVIPGSHDFSPSGKTMLDVLENAGLIENIEKFKENKLQVFEDRTSTLLAGLGGKRNSLEIEEYKELEIEQIDPNAFKIFMFHTAIDEYKPQELNNTQCTPLKMLPQGFNYYAGGHVHYIFTGTFLDGKVVYPGPLFPNNFREIEKLKQGGFYIVNVENNNTELEHIPIKLKEVYSIRINADHKNPPQVEYEIESALRELKDKIVTLRVEGKLTEGTPAQINFKKIKELTNESYAFLKNTTKLTSHEFEIKEDIQLDEEEDVELAILEHHKEEINTSLMKDLITQLDTEKQEGEKSTDFDIRVISEGFKILKLIEDDNKEDNIREY